MASSLSLSAFIRLNGLYTLGECKTGEQVLAALEIVLERTYKQRLSETARTGQEVIQVCMSQLIDKVCFVYIIHTVFANSRKILNADRESL